MADEKDDFANLTPANLTPAEQQAMMEDAALRSQANFGTPERGTVRFDENATDDELALAVAQLLESAPEGQVLEIIQTDTIQAKIAQLPICTLAMDFMVEVLTPIRLIPRILSVSLAPSGVLHADMPTACRDALKTELLREWHDHFKMDKAIYGEEPPAWVVAVDKVELIECDLLVPKEKK